MTIKAIEFSLHSKGNLKQHQAIHNNSPKGDTKQDDDTDTQDNDTRNETILNTAKDNGLKRSSPDSEDSLPSSKRPPGKTKYKSIKSSITVNLKLCLQDAKIDNGLSYTNKLPYVKLTLKF